MQDGTSSSMAQVVHHFPVRLCVHSRVNMHVGARSLSLLVHCARSRGAVVMCATGSGSVRSFCRFPSTVNALQVSSKNVWKLQASSRRHQTKTTVPLSSLKHERRMKRTADHVILGLVVLNCAVTFNWQKVKRFPSRQPVMLRHFTTSTKHLEEGRYYTLLTSVFSHADLGHLFANMVGLYFLGTQMCAVLGPRRFLGIYLGSGVLSSLATVLEQKFSDKVSMNLGASGAINSVTAMSILLNPRSTLLVFGFIPLQAWVTGSLFITKDLYGWVTDSRDGVAHFAHLSGALCGGAYYAYLRQAKKLVR